MPATLADELLARAADPASYRRWAEQVAQVGYCEQPVRLVGQVEEADVDTGEVRTTYASEDEPDGVTLKACGNRRASRCRPCSEVYRRDAWHLIAAGLRGGKGVPAGVAGHPRLFVTFTAPSFGPVHSRRERGGTVRPCHPRNPTARCQHGRSAGCWRRHEVDDPSLGEPICPDCFDYEGVVIWNALAPAVWRRTTIYLRRALAHAVGLTPAEFATMVRVSYAKVAEYQRRGVVHFHALIRLDAAGPSDGQPVEPPPSAFTVEVLEHAAAPVGTSARLRRALPDQEPALRNHPHSSAACASRACDPRSPPRRTARRMGSTGQRCAVVSLARWRFAGRGYTTPTDASLAAAMAEEERARRQVAREESRVAACA